MKRIEDLVPKHKFDFSGLEELKELSDEEIAPILPALLEWMKDMNWPIAQEMPSLLIMHQKVLMPYIVDALKPEQVEGDWKNYIIWDLLPLLDKEYAIEIEPYLERIVENPTRSEVFDETNIEAEDFLQEMRYNREK